MCALGIIASAMYDVRVSDVIWCEMMTANCRTKSMLNAISHERIKNMAHLVKDICAASASN